MKTLPAHYTAEREGRRHLLYTNETGEKRFLGSYPTAAKLTAAATFREQHRPKLANCVPEFQAKIHAIAATAGKTPDAVFALWRAYSDQCDAAGESALLGEFATTYAKQLGAAESTLLALV